jgi:hypothetical protein
VENSIGIPDSFDLVLDHASGRDCRVIISNVLRGGSGTVNYSFKDFATQFAGFQLPVGVLGVAKPAVPPISLRALMDQGAPYAPDDYTYAFVDNSNNNGPSPLVAFFWMDAANYPPWIVDSDSWTGPRPNQLRQATSWNFNLWDANSGASVIAATVPLRNEIVGLVQYDYIGELNGNYSYQITALNNYGSASTLRTPVRITLGSLSPNITVKSLGNNKFAISGTGFQGYPTVKFQVTTGFSQPGKNILSPPSVSVGPTGAFQTAPFSCQAICAADGGGSGGQLHFAVMAENGEVLAFDNTSHTCT